MVCSTIYSLSTPPHRHVREHGDVSHLEGMSQYGGVILRHVLRLACSQRQVRRISSIWDDFVFLDPALFLDSWIVVIFPFLDSTVFNKVFF